MKDIKGYISRHSSAYAMGVVDRITRRSIQIADFPFSGRVVPEIGKQQIREVFESQYRIMYHILSDRIEVLAVIHGARHLDWDSS